MFSKLSLNLAFDPKLDIASIERALEAGGKVVVAAHYSSFADPVIFGVYLPRSPLVITSPSLTRTQIFGDHKAAFRHEAVDYTDAAAADKIKDLIAANDFVVIFPEYEPTTDGILQKISDAVVSALSESGAQVIPAKACNTVYTKYSRIQDRLKAANIPPIRLLSGEPVAIPADGSIPAPRLVLERALNDLIMKSFLDKKPLFDTVLESRTKWGRDTVMAMDPDGTRLTWNDFVVRIVMLSDIIAKISEPGEAVGLMLPNSSMTLACLIAIQHAGRVPAMINYSMGPRGILSACSTARVKTVVTSSRFIAEGKLDPLVDAIKAGGVNVETLEPMLKALTQREMISAVTRAAFVKPSSSPEEDAKKMALILFTSGSEGTPKAVALSHMNIQSNTAQIRTAIPFFTTDIMTAVLPMFHSYGLCTGVIMPLSAGMPIAFYPTPLHLKKIPHYIHEVGATVILGTNAFLAGYAKNAEPHDFVNMRIVVSGGDKLKDATYDLWMKKFGIRIREGYGVTECSPVVGVNRHGRYKYGSIGQPLPCIETYLTPVEGVEGAGRLVVKGPNIMMGYLQQDGSILPVPETGYDTGDICEIDDEGYITIVGRAKRFAKIGAEMVSLAQIEDAVLDLWPDESHAVVTVPDDFKGETIVMLTERAGASIDDVRAWMKKRGMPDISIPKKIFAVERIPRIGVGKIDYQTAGRTAADMMKK